jgi:lysophospholipase L1-like esterase
MVGVGDSLMAGMQAGALLGAPIAVNPLTDALFSSVPDTQGRGVYARVWSQVNGGRNPLNPNDSPLPLIAPPGLGVLGSILVPLKNGDVSALAQPCGELNAYAYLSSTASRTRLNPRILPYDVAIPGQTLHETLTQTQPKPPCVPPANDSVSLGRAQDLTLYPILGNFGPNITQIEAATSLRPTLALVWIGSNDLLGYALGASQAPSPQAFQDDLIQLITTLQNAGAKTAIANLANPIDAAYFVPVPQLPKIVIQTLNVPLLLQPSVGRTIAFLAQTFGFQNGDYITLSGLRKINASLRTTLLSEQRSVSADQRKEVARTLALLGFNSGDIIRASTASSVTTLTASYNQIIAASAQRRGAALVDVNNMFTQARRAVNEHVPIAGKCCSLLYGGGFFSIDGLHPSDTGYAVVANLFIASINRAYAANIPPLSSAQINAINASDFYSPH